MKAKPGVEGDSAASVPARFRVRLFVDFWNLQLTLNEREAAAKRTPEARFQIDWRKLVPCLVQKAADILKAPAPSIAYEGTIVYASYDAKTEDGKKFRKWATEWLDRQPGVNVLCKERQPKAPPKCPKCHQPVVTCPHSGCGSKMAGMIEKGVDTAIVTDMIRLAWEGAYDAAVVVSSDSDFVPAVEFLALKGIKVIQAGFPPLGSALSRACWGAVNLFACREEFRRSAPAAGKGA